MQCSAQYSNSPLQAVFRPAAWRRAGGLIVILPLIVLKAASCDCREQRKSKIWKCVRTSRHLFLAAVDICCQTISDRLCERAKWRPAWLVSFLNRPTTFEHHCHYNYTKPIISTKKLVIKKRELKKKRSLKVPWKHYCHIFHFQLADRWKWSCFWQRWRWNIFFKSLKIKLKEQKPKTMMEIKQKQKQKKVKSDLIWPQLRLIFIPCSGNPPNHNCTWLSEKLSWKHIHCSRSWQHVCFWPSFDSDFDFEPWRVFK